MIREFNVTLTRTEMVDYVVRAENVTDAEILALGVASSDKETHSVRRIADETKPWSVAYSAQVPAVVREAESAAGTIVSYRAAGTVAPALVPDTNSVSGFSKAADVERRSIGGDPTHEQIDASRVRSGLPRIYGSDAEETTATVIHRSAG